MIEFLLKVLRDNGTRGYIMRPEKQLTQAEITRFEKYLEEETSAVHRRIKCDEKEAVDGYIAALKKDLARLPLIKRYKKLWKDYCRVRDAVEKLPYVSVACCANGNYSVESYGHGFGANRYEEVTKVFKSRYDALAKQKQEIRDAIILGDRPSILAAIKKLREL